MNSKLMVIWGIIIVGLIASIFLIWNTNKENLELSYKFDKVVKEATNEYIESENIKLPLSIESKELLDKGYLEKMVLDNKECTAKVNVKKVLFLKFYDINYVCVVSNNE